MHLPIHTQLTESQSILLCGAGGGFDVYSAIPLYAALRKMGKRVVLANYSFSMLALSKGERIGSKGWKITPDCREIGYFPEKYLAEWLQSRGEEAMVIGLEKSGVQPLQKSLQAVKEAYEIDTLILVDGGTDSLMRGDETGLGTPTEDATTMVAANALGIERSFLVCLGFGIDHFHGVLHAQFLENVADLMQKGGFLGVNALLPQEDESSQFLSLVTYANRRGPDHPSIVANSIASALKGKFGDVHATFRTQGSRLFINPLMCQYWYFDLKKVVESLLYADLILPTRTETEVRNSIRDFRAMLPEIRKGMEIPL